jgi:ATP-binding cassette, subfamily B (MDR/TAP), member 1
LDRNSWHLVRFLAHLSVEPFPDLSGLIPPTAEKIAKSVQAASDFNRLLKLAPDSEESRGLLQPTIKGPIIFDQVSFAYPERPEVNVLNQLSMKIDDGECVALVGSSGSGKSTVAALLQRLYEPNSGRILIGSSGKRPLAQINVNYLRKHVAVVSQNPNLFDATIAENIAYGRGKVSLDEIKQAAMAANVHDFIMGLPLQYDTAIGENASLISGGQAQRLQIARALARPSRFLILDECTSSLDAANEAAVMDTIRRAKVGRTTIMITHKLKVMRLCDRILVMHGGELKEHGSYQTLMANNGVFAQLARSGEWVR